MAQFPYHRPSEDRRARRPERLECTGLGYRTGTRERPTPAMLLAMTAGVAIPLGILLILLTGLPGEAWLVAAAGVCVVLLLAARRARAARLRASVRAARHAGDKDTAAP